MSTPKGYQPTEAERLAHRDRQRRLRLARRADPTSSLPFEARALACLLRRFTRRLEAHPPPLHAADAPVLNDAMALALNELTVVASILSPPKRSTTP
jgi:hypothetical protein